MKNIIYTTFVALFFISCSAQKTNLRFKKIIFHTSSCFGTCPEYHLELNKKKEIKLHIEKAYQKREIDTAKMGYYKGKITTEVYKEFLSILNRLDIEKSGIIEPYRAPNTFFLREGSQLSLILYVNNKRKPMIYFYPAGIHIELMTYLYKLTNDKNLYKEKEKFEIETLK